jgi:anti-sigma B factor antagonist
MSLDIEIRFCGNVAIIQCTGRIVAGEEAQSLETAFQTAIREFHRIVLNVAGVTRLDSTGLGIRLAAPPPMIVEVLNITMLSTVFQSYPTEQEAVLSFLHQPTAPAVHDQPGHRVLVVDRSPDLGAFIRAVLTQHGYEVRSASLVSDARVLLQVHDVDYILVGPGTPQMPAATVLASLKTLAPKATALQLTPEFRAFDAHQAAEFLLKMFQESSTWVIGIDNAT